MKGSIKVRGRINSEQPLSPHHNSRYGTTYSLFPDKILFYHQHCTNTLPIHFLLAMKKYQLDRGLPVSSSLLKDLSYETERFRMLFRHVLTSSHKSFLSWSSHFQPHHIQDEWQVVPTYPNEVNSDQHWLDLLGSLCVVWAIRRSIARRQDRMRSSKQTNDLKSPNWLCQIECGYWITRARSLRHQD